MSKIKSLGRKFKDAYFLGNVFIFRVFFPRFRFSWFQLDWWKDQNFNNYLKKFGSHKGMKLLNADRKWHVHQLLRLIGTVEGDTVECGVYTGESSYIICAANKTSQYNRTHHMFDSFEGVSDPVGEIDGKYWSKGDLTASEKVLRDNLKPFLDQCKIYKGWIPERFPEVEAKKIAFVHIDVDLYQPTKDSLEYFYPMLSEGGIILCDDYGFSSCPGATKAMDDFFADKPEKVISLSRGAGFIIKGQHVESQVTYQ